MGLGRVGAARERRKEGEEGQRRWIGGEGTKFWFDSDAGKRKRGIWMSIKEGKKHKSGCSAVVEEREREKEEGEEGEQERGSAGGKEKVLACRGDGRGDEGRSDGH